MVVKTHKTFTLTRSIVARLEDESNQSQTVENALREHYGMEALSDD